MSGPTLDPSPDIATRMECRPVKREDRGGLKQIALAMYLREVGVSAGAEGDDEMPPGPDACLLHRHAALLHCRLQQWHQQQLQPLARYQHVCVCVCACVCACGGGCG